MQFLTNDDPDQAKIEQKPEDPTPVCAMQFEVESDALLSALKLGMKSVYYQGRYGLDILKHVLIEARGCSVTLSTSKLETSISVRLIAHVSHEGVFTIAAKTLLDCVKTFPKQQSVEVQMCEGKLLVKCGKRCFSLKDGTDGSGFPNISLPKMIGPLDEILLPSRDLQQAIREVAFAAATTDQRPTFMGVCLHCLSDQLNVVAIDEHQMALATLAIGPEVEERDVQVLVPSTNLQMLASLLPKDENVVVTWDKHRAAFQAGNITFMSRLIEGQFPNYIAHLRVNHTTTFTLERRDLVSLLEGIDPLFRGFKKMPVQVSYGASGIAFHAESDMGEINDLLVTEVKGEDGQVLLDAVCLAQLLEHVKDRALTFGLAGRSGLVVTTPVGREDYHYVLMPLDWK